MKKLRIAIDLPADISEKDEGLRSATLAAREWAVIKLWEAGHLSTRQAAKALDVTYYDFLDLLSERGVPVMRERSDGLVIEATMAALRREGRVS